MSAEKLFGSWDSPPADGPKDNLESLWHWLAAQRVGTTEQQNNNMMAQRRGEITMLWSLYQRARPKVVLEIGVSQGGTFAGWCFLGRPDALIIGIDRDCNDCLPRDRETVSPHICHHGHYRNTQHGGGMHALGRNKQVIKPINGWSYEDTTISQLTETLAGRQIDWLFNDGSHSAEMAQKDFDLYWPFVSPGGVYASHDVMPSQAPNCNKSQWWDSTRDRDDYAMRMEFFSAKSDDSLGIGLLIKK
jgi:predicted O-methyltransferase YrrM